MFHQRPKNAARRGSVGDRTVRFGMLALLGLFVISPSAAAAGEPTDSALTRAPPNSSPQALSIDPAQTRMSVEWLASKAIKKMPHTIHGDKDWGHTKKLWAGIKVRRDGWKLKTNRRFREVEQGRWVRYEVTLPDPASPAAVGVSVHQVVPIVDHVTGDLRWQIDSSIVAPMNFTAQIQRWNLGIKLFSVTVSGQMQVRLTSSASVGFYADYAEIPPALVVDPRIDHAQLVLERFEVERISKIGGDVAEGWGEVIQEILVERLVKKQNPRLVSKLNHWIEQERDDLRLSMADWLASWQPQEPSKGDP
jgi:hypothetical protein